MPVEINDNARPRCANCDRAMRYGDMGVFMNNGTMICTKCAQKGRVTAEVRILGGDKPSSVDRERAKKNLKWLQRR